MALTKVTNSMIVGAAINAEDYGLSSSGTGASNKTALEAAFAAAAALNAITVLSSGQSYNINAQTTIPANTKLDLNGGTLKLANGQYTTATYPLPDTPMLILGGNNIEIYNGTIDGNRSNQVALTNTSFADNWIGHNAYAMIQGGSPYTDLNIHNCHFMNGIQSCIATRGGWFRIYIRDNFFENISDSAISTTEISSSGPYSLFITGNLIQGIGTGFAGPSPTTQRGWANAILTAFNTDTIIANNIIKFNSDRDCIKLQIPNKTVVDGNVMFDASSGVQVQSADQTVMSVIISNNSIEEMRFSGIYVEAQTVSEESISISGNAVTKICRVDPAVAQSAIPRMGIYCGLTTNASITGNSVKDATYATQGAICISGTNNTIISSNSVASVASYGIQLNYTNFCANVTGNQIYRPGSHGLLIGNTVTAYGDNNYHVINGNSFIQPGYGNSGTFYGLNMPQIGGVNNKSFNLFTNNLTVGKPNNIISDNFVAYNNIAVGNYANNYIGVNIVTGGNGYFDSANVFVPAP
jgi:hypothetical protein